MSQCGLAPGGLPRQGPSACSDQGIAVSAPIEQGLFPWQFQTERIPDRAESLGRKSRCSI